MILANGDEIKLTYNLAALVDIENEFEGLTDLGEILSDSKHALRDTVSLLRIGVNTTIARENELKGENCANSSAMRLPARWNRPSRRITKQKTDKA